MKNTRLQFSCPIIDGNAGFLSGPHMLECRQTTVGNATGNWYIIDVSIGHLGGISTTPECISKDHTYFFSNILFSIACLNAVFFTISDNHPQ